MNITNMTYKQLSFCLLLVLYLCSSCSGQSGLKDKEVVNDSVPNSQQEIDIMLPGSFIAVNQMRFDSLAIGVFMKQFPECEKYKAKLIGFYSKRKYTYAWFDSDGIIEQVENLRNKIYNIADEGLPERKLYRDTFQLMIEDNAAVRYPKPNLTLELMLTVQYLFYAQTVWTGLGSKAMQALDWDLPKKKLAYEKLLDSLLEIPSSRFMTTEPVYPQYAKLKEYLKKCRDIQTAGGWSIIKADRKSYKKGDSSTSIISIRKRLFLSGDIVSDNQSPKFDTELESAVIRFQQRYGFNDDGIVTTKLIAEMNYPVEKRIEQIIVNMERCRWLPVALKKDYMVINIPEYRFHAFENDSLAWSMDVVVGTAANKTAVFSGLMNTVVFSPYWNIPPGIMKNETLPAIRRDKNYLKRNNMEWNGKMVRQKPGPWNALGKVKFLFPNSHSIYLHDTPSKYPFSQDQRAFSHGCVRVSDPERLATYVLRHQQEWTAGKIRAAMNATTEKYVTINNPIPVLLAYFTSWVDKDGRLNFRNDVYKRDSRLAKMILENSKL